MALIGKKSKFSFGIESIYATEVTADRWLGIVTKVEDGGNKNDLIQIKGVDETTLNIDAYKVATVRRGIDITFLLQHGVPIAWAFGKDTVVDNGDGSYTHTITEGDLKSLTIEVAEKDSAGDHVERYPGCKPNSFKVEWNAGNPVTHTISVIAQKSTHPDTITPYNTSVDRYKKYSAYDIEPFMSKHVDVMINGVDVATNISGSINLDYALKAEPVCDTTTGIYIAEPFPTKREFTVDIRGYVIKDNDYDNILNLDTTDRLTGTTTITFTRNATDYVNWMYMQYTLVDPIVESISKPIDVDNERAEFSITLKPTDVTVEIIDTISGDYLT